MIVVTNLLWCKLRLSRNIMKWKAHDSNHTETNLPAAQKFFFVFPFLYVYLMHYLIFLNFKALIIDNYEVSNE